MDLRYFYPPLSPAFTLEQPFLHSNDPHRSGHPFERGKITLIPASYGFPFSLPGLWRLLLKNPLGIPQECPIIVFKYGHHMFTVSLTEVNDRGGEIKSITYKGIKITRIATAHSLN
jgi:hypothetical protein